MLRDLVRHPFVTGQLIAKRISEIPSRGLPRLRRTGVDEFDRKYGVETAGIVRVTAAESPNFKFGQRYEASGEEVVRWCIENCGFPLEETTFIDIGSGKGRTLIVASRYPFARIVGVEYSKDLTDICKRNLEILGIVGRCEVITGDALDFKLPSGKLLVYFHNPFTAEVHSRVLRNVAAAPGPVRIGHLGPGHEVIQASGVARILQKGEHAALYEILASGKASAAAMS